MAGDTSPSAAAVADGAPQKPPKTAEDPPNGLLPASEVPSPTASAERRSPAFGQMTNGQSVLHRRDTPHGSLLENVSNGHKSAPADPAQSTPLCSKPISQIESASQADFFKMLDEKIAHGAGEFPDSDLDD
ncbi:hypothetical protein L596_014780 [Steinernema carpocapsae]|uniref:Uncharacterized protein n=1 Tax=Steinernema carpocapsae TaxID=34508 RepID=A0A4U5NDS9_STECR|nr:hypothetical protein L596_014780 [Steinernema carpocapsae]